MKLTLDYYDKDLLVDCIEYRLQNDKELVINDSLRGEIEDLLTIIEDELV